MTSRTWCYVLNNYTTQEETQLKSLVCKYHRFSKEVGDKCGTPHLQGHITFCTSYRMAQLKKLNPRISWRITKVNDHSINYCTKGEIWEVDNRKQGTRTDLADAIKAIKDGMTRRDFINNFTDTWIKYSSSFDKLFIEFERPRDFPPEVYWLYGPTGTGKTRYVTEREDDLWYSGRDLKFWDGYSGHEAIVLDDFRSDFCTFHELLRILDRYPYRVNVKHGSRELIAKRIYISSPYHPKDTYKTIEDKTQLIRRITEIIEFPLIENQLKDEPQSETENEIQNVTEVAGGNTILPPNTSELTSNLNGRKLKLELKLKEDCTE